MLPGYNDYRRYYVRGCRNFLIILKVDESRIAGHVVRAGYSGNRARISGILAFSVWRIASGSDRFFVGLGDGESLCDRDWPDRGGYCALVHSALDKPAPSI